VLVHLGMCRVSAVEYGNAEVIWYVCFIFYKPCVGPWQSLLPIIPSISHLLLYLLVFFTFSFLTCFIYFLAFPSFLILSE